MRSEPDPAGGPGGAEVPVQEPPERDSGGTPHAAGLGGPAVPLAQPPQRQHHRLRLCGSPRLCLHGGSTQRQTGIDEQIRLSLFMFFLYFLLDDTLLHIIIN